MHMKCFIINQSNKLIVSYIIDIFQNIIHVAVRSFIPFIYLFINIFTVYKKINKIFDAKKYS